MPFNEFNLEGLEFPKKVKDIPKFERLNRLNLNVSELTGTVLTPIHINTNYDRSQIDLLLYENHFWPNNKVALSNKETFKHETCM